MDALKKRPYLFGGMLIVGVIAGVWLANYSGMTADVPSDEEVAAETDTVQSGAGEITVSPQPAGRAVVVSQVVLPQKGWIVVHESNNGALSNALGAARRDAGQHTGVVVELLRNTEPGKNYFVVLYADNGNNTFELKEDALISDEDGVVLKSAFTAQTPLSPAGN